MALFGFQIIKFLQKFIKSKNIYITSFDVLPNKIRSYPAYFVVNLDKNNGLGTHWIGIHFSKNREAFYFCSFASVPCKKILKFMYQNSRKIEFSSKVLQSSNSSVCGYYVCAFLIFCSKNKNINNLIDMFTKIFSYNFILNDYYIIKFCNNISNKFSI